MIKKIGCSQWETQQSLMSKHISYCSTVCSNDSQVVKLVLNQPFSPTYIHHHITHHYKPFHLPFTMVRVWHNSCGKCPCGNNFWFPVIPMVSAILGPAMAVVHLWGLDAATFLGGCCEGWGLVTDLDSPQAGLQCNDTLSIRTLQLYEYCNLQLYNRYSWL